MAQYQVAKGKIRIPKSDPTKYLNTGDLIPPGLIAPREIPRLLQLHLIREYEPLSPEQNQARIVHQGKWCFNPANLSGKSLEELRILVNAVDPEFPLDSLKGIDDATRLLSSDFDPALATAPAKAKPAKDPLRRLKDDVPDQVIATNGKPDPGASGTSARLEELKRKASAASKE